MKELSIEEKAKAYDEALERARKELQACGSTDCDAARQIFRFFPELKESEDERIRKAIISVFASHKDYEVFFGVSVENILAWLEKQGTSKKDATREKVAEYLKNLILDQSQRGFPMLNYEGRIEEEVDFIISIAKKELKQDEQKHADKVKYKVGDWVVSPNGVYWHIDKISNNRYEVTSNTGESSDWSLDANIYRSFSIQDAKDGDVLATKDSVFIFKHMDKTGLSLCKSYCEVIGNSKLGFGFDFSINDVYPATKEQRDALFAKIHKAGYKWDAEKKELKKIEQKPIDCNEEYYNEELKSALFTSLRDAREQYLREKNAAWSDEDEEMLEDVRNNFEFNKGEMTDSLIAQYDKFFDKIKFLKPQPKPKWSEEDALRLEEVICTIEANGRWVRSDDAVKLNLDWLKSLEQRIGG